MDEVARSNSTRMTCSKCTRTGSAIWTRRRQAVELRFGSHWDRYGQWVAGSSPVPRSGGAAPRSGTDQLIFETAMANPIAVKIVGIRK